MNNRRPARALSSTQYFHLHDRLATEVQGQSLRTLLVTEEHLVAQLRRGEDGTEVTGLATDLKRSVLQACESGQRQDVAYTPYGFHRAGAGLVGLPAFNGELQDAHTAHYLLGAGYRAYNTVLMRFQSPDSWSPFGEGGLNAYVFVVGDPINKTDPTGHMPAESDRQGSAPHRLPPKAPGSPGLSLPQVRRRSADVRGMSRLSVSSSQEPSSNRVSGNWSSSSLSLASCGSDDSRAPRWALSKVGAQFKASGLTGAEQAKFDTFQNAIHHFGMSPKNAAMLAGAADYKQLDKNTALFQIRLSQSERATFTVKDKLVEIRQVGGHT